MATQAGVAYVSVEYDPRGLSKFGTASGVASRRFESTWKQSASRAGRYIGLGLAAGGVAAAVGIGKAIKSAGDFQQQLNVLQAVSGATAGQMKAISAEAIQLGKDVHLPATSAQDAALAMTELTKAGLGVGDAMKAARGTLELAAAGEVDAGTAAKVAATALNQFHLAGSQATHVADLLAGAANASAGDVTDFAEGLQYAGTAAHAAGQSIDLTVAALAEMANAGLQGSVAGSSLAQAMRALQAPTAKAQDAMQKFGLNIYDATGKMKPLDEISQVFTDHLGDLTQKQQNATLAQIFGSRAVQAARVVFLGGADALDKYEKKVSASGNAQRLAAARMKGFSGAIQAFQSNIETLGIQLGLVLLPAATNVVRALSNVVDVISQIAQARTPRIAIGIAWQGVGRIYDSLKAALFGEVATAGSGGLGHQAAHGIQLPISVDKKGLIPQIAAALGGAVQAVNWRQVGSVIATNFAAALRFTTSEAAALVKSITTGIAANHNQIADAGAQIGAELVANLLDPGFWAKNWKTFLAIGIALFPVGKLGALGKAFAGSFGRAVLRVIPAAFRPVIDVVGRVIIGGLERISPAAARILRGVGSSFVGVFRDALLAVDVFFRAGWRRIGSNILNILRGEATRFPNLFNRGFRVVERVAIRAFHAILGAARGIFRSLFGSAETEAGRAFREIERDGKRVFVDVEQAGERAFRGIGGAITRAAGKFGLFLLKIGVVKAAIGGVVSAFQTVYGWVQSIIGKIEELASKIASIHFPSIPGGGLLHDLGVPGTASGGVTAQSGWQWTGERGPELEWKPRGSVVVPLSRIPDLSPMGSAGGDTYVTVKIGERDITDIVDMRVERRERRQSRRLTARGAH